MYYAEYIFIAINSHCNGRAVRSSVVVAVVAEHRTQTLIQQTHTQTHAHICAQQHTRTGIGQREKEEAIQVRVLGYWCCTM